MHLDLFSGVGKLDKVFSRILRVGLVIQCYRLLASLSNWCAATLATEMQHS